VSPGGPVAAGWTVERRRGSAADLHDLDWPAPVERTVWVFEVERAALVLGSGQPPSDVDHDAVRAAGVDLARRRSGGGAVLLVPGEVVWIDVLVPVGDPLWSDDVRLAFHWLGDAWVAALAHLGVSCRVHRGGMEPTRWSARVCFAGLGPGEVVTGGAAPAPAKVVGLSQRRTRHGARLQSAVHRRFSAAAMVDLLDLPPADRAAAAAELTSRVVAVDAPAGAIESAFLASLP
jgi:lipoate-protein ligase A